MKTIWLWSRLGFKYFVLYVGFGSMMSMAFNRLCISSDTGPVQLMGFLFGLVLAGMIQKLVFNLRMFLISKTDAQALEKLKINPEDLL